MCLYAELAYEFCKTKTHNRLFVHHLDLHKCWYSRGHNWKLCGHRATIDFSMWVFGL